MPLVRHVGIAAHAWPRRLFNLTQLSGAPATLAVLLVPQFGWHYAMPGQLVQWLNVFHQLTTRVMPHAVFAASFAACVVAVWALLLGAAYMGLAFQVRRAAHAPPLERTHTAKGLCARTRTLGRRDVQRNAHHHHLWVLRVLRVFMALLSTAALVPLLQTLIAPVGCDDLARMTMGESFACGSAMHGALITIAVVTLLAFVPALLGTVLVYAWHL